MRLLLPGSLLLVACTAACQVTTNVTVRRATAASPAAVATSVGTSASLAPAVPSNPKPSASARAALKLLGKPATAFRMLAGTLQMDARYAVDASAGKLLSNNGSGVLGNNGSSVIANNAGNVISNNSSGVLLVGSGIISDAGNLMLSKGNLISDAGALAIAPGSKRYGLQAAETKVPIGTIVPAAGMALRATDVGTGKPIPLGVAADGSPVYEIYTNGQGQYEVYLPADVADNVLFTARVPGNSDTRLAYDLLSSKTKQNTAIDEDTAKATYYVRNSYAHAWARRLRGIEPMGLGAAGKGYGGDDGSGAVTKGSTRLAQVAADAHLDQLSDEAIQALALQITDLILTRVDPATAPISKHTFNFDYDGPDESIFDGYAGVFKQCREAVTQKMRQLEASGQDPLVYFNTQAYLEDANKGRATPYVIKKPGDLVDFVADYYLSQASSVDQSGMLGALVVVGDVGLQIDALERFIAATAGMSQAESQVMYLDAQPLVDQVISLIQRAAPAATPSPAS